MNQDTEERDCRVAGIAEGGESVLKIKFWGVVAIAVGLFGWLFVAYQNHEIRITKMETQYISICEKLSDIKVDTKEIKKNVDDFKYHSPFSSGSR